MLRFSTRSFVCGSLHSRSSSNCKGLYTWWSFIRHGFLELGPKTSKNGQIKGNIWHFYEVIEKISLIDIWYFVNIFLETPYISLYLANSWLFLVPVPGNRDLSSVVYGGFKSAWWSSCVTRLRFWIEITVLSNYFNCRFIAL